jgi:AcrR family transcriptional regulator
MSMPKVIDETEIFKAALAMLVAQGYEGATLQKIADLAGINEVTLFRRYGNKAGLFEMVINDRLAATPLSKLVYTGDLEADLLTMLEAYLATNEAVGDFVPIIFVELPRNPDLQGSFIALKNNIGNLIAIIRRYQQQGLLKDESPFASLGALIGPILVHQMARRANFGLPVPAIDAREHVDAFLHGRKLAE